MGLLSGLAVVLEGVARELAPHGIAGVEGGPVQLSFPGGEVLFKLSERTGADDDRVDRGLRREPAEGQRYRADPSLGRDLDQRLYGGEIPLAPVARVVLPVQVEARAGGRTGIGAVL